MTAEVLPYTRTALAGLREFHTLLVQTRDIAVISANIGVNDQDLLHAHQAEIDYNLDTMNRIVRNTHHDQVQLLDGSAGLTGTTNSTEFDIRRVLSSAVPGSYSVETLVAAERATVEAPIVQLYPLTEEETITVNEVSIRLSGGLSQVDVVHAINEWTWATQVVADREGVNNATRLRTIRGGRPARISVITNVSPAADSSGFGTTELADMGLDAIVAVDSIAEAGTGAFVTVDTGAARGLHLALRYSYGQDATHTVRGMQGDVTIIDQSFEFAYPSGAVGRIAFPNVSPRGLGLGVGVTSASSLEEISVYSPSGAADAVGIIRQAEEDVLAEITRLEGLSFGVPQSTNLIEVLGSTQFLLRDATVSLLEAGTVIGPDGVFGDSAITLASDSDGYLGFQLSGDQGKHFGWIHVVTDSDRGIVVLDAAIATNVGQPITSGVVPEPSTLGMGGFALLAWMVWRRRRRHS